MPFSCFLLVFSGRFKILWTYDFNGISFSWLFCFIDKIKVDFDVLQ